MRKRLSNGAMVLLVLLSLAEALTGRSLSALTAAAAAVVLAVNLPVMGKTFRLPAWVFSAVGAAVLLLARAPLAAWAGGLNSMLKTAVILIAMQTLTLAMRRGGCEGAVAGCLRTGARSLGGLACLVLLLSHLLAGVMSLGAVVVILAAVGPALAGTPEGKRFLAGAVSKGYCTLFLWAPGTVTVLMSMQVFSLDWEDYFPPALLLAVLGLSLGAAVSLVQYRGLRPPEQSGAAAPAGVPGEHRRKLLGLGGVLAVLVAGITLLERLRFSNSTGRLLLVTLAVSGTWLLLQRWGAPRGGLAREWWEDYLPQNGDLSAFFLSMGLFSAAVQHAGLDGALARLLEGFRGPLEYLALPLLPLVITALSLVGLHPFVSVLTVGPVLAGLALPVSPLQLGLAMSLGCCLSYMLSPFAGLILVLSNGLDEPPARVCLGNLGYAATYYVLALGVIALLPGGL